MIGFVLFPDIYDCIIVIVPSYLWLLLLPAIYDWIGIVPWYLWLYDCYCSLLSMIVIVPCYDTVLVDTAQADPLNKDNRVITV